MFAKNEELWKNMDNISVILCLNKNKNQMF